MADTSESPAEQDRTEAGGSDARHNSASAADLTGPEYAVQVPRLDWRERLLHSVATGQRGLMALALLVGAGAGLGAIAFRYMILGFTYLFSGHKDYSAVGHAGNPCSRAWGSGSLCSRRSSAG